MSKQVIEQLQRLKHAAVNPRTDWVKSKRDILLRQITNTLPAPSPRVSWRTLGKRAWAGLSIFLPRPVVYGFVRPLAIMVAVAVVATTSFKGAAEASKGALPGEILYPAKRAGEGLELAVIRVTGIVADTSHNEAELHVKFAGKRAAEIKEITGGDDLASKAHVLPDAVSDLNSELKAANEQLEQIKKEPSKNLSTELAKGVQEDTRAIKDLLHTVEKDVTSRANSQNIAKKDEDSLSAQLKNAKETADATAFKVVEAVVSKDNLSKEEVAEVVGTAILTVATEAVSSKEGAQGVKTITAAANDAATLEAKKQSDTTASTTQALKQLATAVAQTTQAAAEVNEKSATVAQKVTEAQTLVSSGKLSEAVEKIKEANAVSKEAKTILDSTLQSVLPIVQVKEVKTDDPAPTATSTKDVTVSVSSTTLSISSDGKSINVTVPNSPVISQIISSTPQTSSGSSVEPSKK